MKLFACALCAALAAGIGCKRADPKETQMSGERPAPAAPEPLNEAPIAAPGERIPTVGEIGLKGAPAESGKTKDTSFQVALTVPPDGASGSVMVANVKVTPGEGYKVNEEFPTKLTLEPLDGVSTAKPVLLKADASAFDKHQLAFDVKLTPTRAGNYTVRGTLAFAVCTEATCDPKSEKIAINLVAK
jgi:hypothetical protein